MLWWTLRQLKSKDDETRKRAAEKLGESGNARAVKPLIAVLKDSKWSEDSTWSVRNAAEEALVKIGDARAVKPLIIALKASDYKVRKVAARALGAIGDARAVEPLIIALKDSTGCAPQCGKGAKSVEI